MPLSHEITQLRNELRELRDDIREIGEKVIKTDVIVSALAEDFNDERERTRQHYTDLTQVIAALSGSVKTLAEKVAEMKPTVDAVMIEKHELAGKQKLLRRQWAILAAVGAFGAWAIGQVIGLWPTLWSAIQSRGKP